MARENVAKFEEKIRTDKALQAKVKELSVAWAGDKIDGEALFEATVASAAAEVGLPFTYEELKEQANGRELDDAELEAVAGGGGECALIGFTDDAECECSKSGQVCAFLGITF